MTAALDIQNLHKTYHNGFTALQGINLRVEQGDFFALLGAMAQENQRLFV